MGTWIVAYVKSRMEKAFSADMDAAGIPSYLPLTTYRGVLNGRKNQLIQRPTFPGYAFFACRGTVGSLPYAADLYKVKSNFRLVTLIEIRAQKKFVQEISQFQRALEIDPQLGGCPTLRPGQQVIITSGPFQGMIGYAEAHLKGIVHLRCSMLGSSVVLDISEHDIVPA